MKTLLRSILVAAATAITTFAADAPRDLVVHEWGTFTSVQGGDGAMLRWQAQEIGDLPRFVHDWIKPGLGRQATQPLSFGKGGVAGLQRMETPVIYFYSDTEFNADVEVKFPKGLITEWYPQTSQIGPASLKTNVDAAFARHVAKESLIQWQNIRVSPTKRNTELDKLLPTDTKGTHYFAARETDSAFVRAKYPSPTGTVDEHEKFLFYRGTGSFGTPLVVTTSNDGTVSLHNTGAAPLMHLFLLHVENGRAEWAQLEKLDAKTQQPWRRFNSVPTDQRPLLAEFQKEIGDVMAKALAGVGLYPAEARAMVKTWSNAWFAEEGVRVLYILPRAWTDEVLPLKLNPKPRELVRVMVGRAEVITPELQKELGHQLKLANEGHAQAKDRLQAYWKKMGRFYGPAMQLANAQLEREKNKPVATVAGN